MSHQYICFLPHMHGYMFDCATHSINQSISLYFRQKHIEQQKKCKHRKPDRTDTQENTSKNYD